MVAANRKTTLARAASLALRAALTWLLTTYPAALAHGPTELLQVVASAPDDVLLATNRGLVFGTLAPRSWSLLCSEAFDLATADSYRAARLPSGRLIVASRSGARFSDDRGCSWRELPALAASPTPQLVQHPGRPLALYVVSEQGGSQTLRASDDGGEHFRTVLTLPEQASVTSLLLVPSHADQLYLSATVGPLSAPTGHFVARSLDSGAHWERSDVPLLDTERDLTLLTIAEARPDHVIARAGAREPSRGERVLFSRDGGRTFAAPTTFRMLRAAAFSRDGATAYIGGVDGVARSGDLAAPFEPPSGAWIHFLEQRPDGLFAAGYYAGIEAQLNGVGVRSASGLAFVPWMSFNEVAALVDCPQQPAVALRCTALLQDFLRENPRSAAPPTYVIPDAREAAVQPAARSDAAALALDAGGAGSTNVGRGVEGADSGSPHEPTASASRADVGVDAGRDDAAAGPSQTHVPAAPLPTVSGTESRRAATEGCALLEVPSHARDLTVERAAPRPLLTWFAAWLLLAARAVGRRRKRRSGSSRSSAATNAE
jgi:hypothetical protein